MCSIYHPILGKRRSSVCHNLYRKYSADTNENFRYKKENLLQIFITYGEKKPSNIWSYLAPTIEYAITLQKHGMQITTHSGETYFCKAFVLALIGDIPAIAEIALHRGHCSLYGCRICTVQGLKTAGRRGFSYPVQVNNSTRNIRKKRDFEQVTVRIYNKLIKCAYIFQIIRPRLTSILNTY